MAEVYWIHLPEHTDMFTEGYIGITKHTALHRYKGHVYAARRSDRYSLLGNVIKKYGPENLIVETLIICTEDYASWLENQLRPVKGIGWNMAVGGDYAGGNRVVTAQARYNMSKAGKGRKISEETKEKISIGVSKARKGTKHPESTKEKISNSAKGRRQTAESLEKAKITKFYNTMYKNREVYSIADLLHEYYLKGLNSYAAEMCLSFVKGSLDNIFKHFENGWNPSDDLRWLKEYKLEKEASVGSRTFEADTVSV